MHWALIIALWVGVLVALFLFTTFIEERAAMRGTHRKPLSRLTDKLIRVVFLIIFAAPLYFIIPGTWLALALLLYTPLFLDGAERTGARRSGWFSGLFIFRFIKWYFHLNIVASAGRLDPSRQYIIGLHPHGFLPVGTMVAVLTDVCGCREKLLNGVELRALVASFCFFIPGYRDFLLAGGIIDAARYNARGALSAGVSLALVPGGATEGLYAAPGKHILILRRRKGFIKLALETGSDLVPSYSFGETNCYNQLSDLWPWVRKFQRKFQSIIGFSLPIVTNIIPRRSPITVVFGAPIPVRQPVLQPTEEQVQALLDTYIAQLTQLFNEQAPHYIPNPAERTLVIL